MANANWSNPQLTSTYTNFLSEVKNRDEDLALQFDGTTSTNILTNTIRWDSTAGRWKKWSGTTWGELAATYALTGLSTTGAATIGTTLSVTGTITGSSTVTGTALIPSGSAVPVNGIYLPSANNVAIATNSLGRVFVDASGNVGVGGSPTAFGGGVNTLTVRTSAAIGGVFQSLSNGGTDSRFYSTDTGSLLGTFSAQPLSLYTNTTPRITILSGGNVGIGTTGPGSAIDVQTSAQTLANFSSTNANGGYVTVGRAGALSIYGNYSSASGGGTQINADALFFRSSNGIGFGPAGAVVGAFLDTSGRLGIGTISPGAPLSVNGNAIVGPESGTRLAVNLTENDKVELQVIDSTSTARALALIIGITEAARIDSSGRLLVGTSSARTMLSGTIPSLQVEDSTGALSIRRNIAVANPVPANLILGRARGSAFESVISEDGLGQISFTGADGSAQISAASIYCVVDGTPGANDMPGRLMFFTTADGAASPTERLRITNDGVMCHDQPTPATYAAAATLTVADLKTGIITYTGGAATLTLPTGTLTEGGFAGIYTNMTFEWSVINTGSGLCTIGAGTGHTITGGATIAAGASGRFATRRTAANTFISYRLS